MLFSRWISPIVLLPVLFFGCNRQAGPQGGFEMPPVDVTAITIKPKTIPADFEYVGVVQSYHKLEIRSRVEGYLQKIFYTEGTLVKAGEVLFQIDPTSFEAALENAQGDLAVQKATLWNTTRNLERLEPLFKENAASRKDLDDALAAKLTAEAQVASAEARVKQAELDLGYTSISTPNTGLAGESTYGEGALITPSSNPLTIIASIDHVYVSFHMSESDLLKQRREVQKNLLTLPKDQNFAVELVLADGSVYSHKGKVDFTEPTFRPDTGTMMMRALFPNPEGILRPGFFVRVRLTGATRTNAIVIPQRAVLQGTKGMFVYLIIDNKAVIQEVQTADWYGNDWIISSGLKKDDVVIVDGVNKVEAGSPVVVKEWLTNEVGSLSPQSTSTKETTKK